MKQVASHLQRCNHNYDFVMTFKRRIGGGGRKISSTDISSNPSAIDKSIFGQMWVDSITLLKPFPLNFLQNLRCFFFFLFICPCLEFSSLSNICRFRHLKFEWRNKKCFTYNALAYSNISDSAVKTSTLLEQVILAFPVACTINVCDRNLRS